MPQTVGVTFNDKNRVLLYFSKWEHFRIRWRKNGVLWLWNCPFLDFSCEKLTESLVLLERFDHLLKVDAVVFRVGTEKHRPEELRNLDIAELLHALRNVQSGLFFILLCRHRHDGYVDSDHSQSQVAFSFEHCLEEKLSLDLKWSI